MSPPGTFWLQRIIWIFDRRRSATAVGAAVLAGSLVGLVWTVAEAAGVKGSVPLAVLLIFFCGLGAALVSIVAGPLRWFILFKAIRDYVRSYLLPDLTAEKILVGIGPGGAIAVGMVAKAIRDLGCEPPSVLVFDMRYEARGSNPQIGALWPQDHLIDTSRCWIIQGNISSGRSLQELQERFSLKNCPIFAFVVSEHVAVRENVTHYMAVGSRNVLPWITEQPHPRF
jgi:hypothetical protein